MMGTPTRIRLALERLWCGLRGHEPMLTFRRASVAARCSRCGDMGAGVEEGRDPRPPSRLPLIAAGPPPMPPVPARPTVQVFAGSPPRGGAELRVINLMGGDGRLTTASIQMTTEEIIEFSVAFFQVAAQATGLTHAEIGARVLRKGTGIRQDLCKSIANEVVGRIVLTSMRPTTRA